MKKTAAEQPENEAIEPKGPKVRITASESRRRAGRRFPKGVAVDVAASEFSEDDWKAIAADPVLNIVPFTD